MLPELTGNLPGHTFIPGVSGQMDSYQQTEKSYASFTNETYSLTDHLDLTAGLRYTHESKDETANFTNPDGGAACGALLHAPPHPSRCRMRSSCCSAMAAPLRSTRSLTASSTASRSVRTTSTRTVKLSYRFTDDVMGYASWGNGTKAGGFNLARVTNPAAANPLAPILDTEFPRETVNSFEVGVKSELAQRTLRLNAAVFDQQYHDFQLNTFTGIVFVVSSLPDVELQGRRVERSMAHTRCQG